MSKLSVGKGAAYIYIELLVAAFSGYILWLLLSKITTPSVIGASSTVVSLATIFSAVISLGIPNGIPRQLGKMFTEKKLEDARLYVKASVFLTALGILAGTITIFLTKDLWILNSLDSSLIILSILLMGATAMTTLFRFIVISSLRTKLLVSRQVISATLKVSLSIILILIGLGALGLTIGLTASQIIAAILIALVTVVILKSPNKPSTISFKQSCKSIIDAGFPSWLPSAVTTIGSQAGTIIVFGTSGPSQAGTYFIAFSIFSAIYLITSSLLSAAFPALSAMTSGRKKFTTRITKISLIFSLPLSCSIIFYSRQILGLINQDYVQEATSLQILLLSILPIAVMTSINTLVYSYGNYRQVLEIGLALSIPRALLYFVFVPFFGGMGAAMSFTIGAITGFIISISIAHKIGLRILWKDLCLMFATCMGLAFILSSLEINFILGVPFTLLASYLLLIKVKILTRDDIQDTLGILPLRISRPTIKVLNIIGRKLDPSY